jgi:LysM repeat protein
MTTEKLNIEYKPLGVAVFLAIGGLLSGLIWSALFVSGPVGMVQERRIPGGPSLIPQAQGAEIDSAALTPQSSPSLTYTNTGLGTVQPAENTDILYGRAALKDSEPVVKIKAVAPTSNVQIVPDSGAIYKVKAGYTAKSISVTFNIPIDTIVEFNPSVNFSSLTAGVVIVIPGQKDAALLAGQN